MPSVVLLAFASLFVVVYTYAGYPALVAGWSRLFPRPIEPRDGFEPTVSVLLPVFDGAGHLVAKLRNLCELDYPPGKIEFLVFSDGSTDATLEIIAKAARSDPRVRFLSSDRRLGKPTALNSLGGIATGAVFLMCDVRQTMNPGALRALLRSLSDPSVGCVSGALVLAGNTGAGAYWRYERHIRGAEAAIGSMVGVSGSIYVIRREDMPTLPSDVLLDDMFVPLHVALTTKKRIVLEETAEARDTACDDDREFVRKVRTLAGNFQLMATMPQLLVPLRNPLWFQMTSHKLLRLACPWALGVLLWASAVLAFSSAQGTPPAELAFFRLLLAAQLACYALAAAGPLAGKLGSLARTFVVLNAAAVVGFFRFVRGSQAVTW